MLLGLYLQIEVFLCIWLYYVIRILYSVPYFIIENYVALLVVLYLIAVLIQIDFVSFAVVLLVGLFELFYYFATFVLE
jgi:hypothetical protein